jgi:TonB family protein
MSTPRSLHPDPPARIFAVAFVTSLVLHAVLIAWPRWPEWRETGSGVDAAGGAIRARLLAPAVASPVDAAIPHPSIQEPVAQHEPLDATSAVAWPAPAALATSTADREDAAVPGGGRSARRVDEPLEARDRPPAHARSPDRRPASQQADSSRSSASRSAIASASRAAGVSSMNVDAASPTGAIETATTAPAPAARAERGERSDIASIAQYRIMLIGASRRFKPPSEAILQAGIEGRVDVQLAIAADGSLADARVVRSSGHVVLDGLAVDMLRNAKAQAPVPPLLLDRAFEVDVPVVFSRSAAEEPAR